MSVEVAGPVVPRAAASIAVFKGDQVLLARRSNPPAGVWSLPGGKIEPGERAMDAALRELNEETGVSATLSGLVDVRDVILRTADGIVHTQYLIAVHFGTWLSGEPSAADDVSDARFFDLTDLRSLEMTPGTRDLVMRAHGRFG